VSLDAARPLLPREVHTWVMPALEAYPLGDKPAPVLDAQESMRADSFASPDESRRWVRGRSILRYLLGSYLAIEPSDVELAYSTRGKPRLRDASIDLKFNLSHCPHFLLYGFSRRADLGVDVECVSRLADQGLASSVLDTQELARYSTLLDDDKARALARCWVRKEAYLKATGEGLSRGMGEFFVGLDEYSEWHDANPWNLACCLHDLPIRPDHAGSLVVISDRPLWRWVDMTSSLQQTDDPPVRRQQSVSTTGFRVGSCGDLEGETAW